MLPLFISLLGCMICRVGQNTPYMTVHLVISLPNAPYIHRTYMIYGSSQPYRCVMAECAAL